MQHGEIGDLEEQLKAKNKWIAQLLEQVELLTDELKAISDYMKTGAMVVNNSRENVLDKIKRMNEKMEKSE